MTRWERLLRWSGGSVLGPPAAAAYVAKELAPQVGRAALQLGAQAAASWARGYRGVRAEQRKYFEEAPWPP